MVIRSDRHLLPRAIDVSEVATMLSISTRTVWRLVARGELPQPIRFGRSARWRVVDIETWLENRVTSTNNNGNWQIHSSIQR